MSPRIVLYTGLLFFKNSACTQSLKLRSARTAHQLRHRALSTTARHLCKQISLRSWAAAWLRSGARPPCPAPPDGRRARRPPEVVPRRSSPAGRSPEFISCSCSATSVQLLQLYNFTKFSCNRVRGVVETCAACHSLCCCALGGLALACAL